MALSTGVEAPDFKLSSTESDEDVTLSSFRGNSNVLLLFHPLAFSGVCTDEFCAIRDTYYEQYKNLNVEVFGISVDSKFSQKAWSDANNYPVAFLSDFNKKVTEDYQILDNDFFGMVGVSKRSAFLIDKEGIIRYATSSDDPTVVPDFEIIKSELEKLG